MNATLAKNETKKITKKPLVSIIVATYRRYDSFKKAILSLICQTYDNIEIIVIDDNVDKLWNSKIEDIIINTRNESKKKIIYFKNTDNKGSAESRNIGIKLATGEYITFLDDDDIYLPNKVVNQLSNMLEMHSDFSLTDLNLYTESDKLIEKRTRNYIKKNMSKVELFKFHFMYHLTGTNCMMFKKDYLLRIKGFSPIDVGDEFYLMQKAIEAEGEFSYLHVCDVKAYVHIQSDGLSSGESKIKGENMLYEYKKEYFPQLDKKEIRYIKMRHYAVLAFAELRRKRIIAFLKNCIFSFMVSPLNCIKLILEKL